MPSSAPAYGRGGWPPSTLSGRAPGWPTLPPRTRQPPRPFDAALLEHAIADPLARVTAHFGPEVVPPAHLAATLALARTQLGVPSA